MPKIQNNMKSKKNTTEERLRATPFNTVEELEAENKAIRMSVWRRFTESKIIEELLTKPEYKHVLEEFKAGLSCGLNSSGKDQIYKIFSDGRGLKLELNKEFSESLGEHQIQYLQGIIQAGIEGYGALYMQAKSLVKKPEYDLKGKELPLNKNSPNKKNS